MKLTKHIPTPIERMGRILDRVLKQGFVLSGTLILLTAICVFYNVMTRYILHDPSIIAYELAKMFLIGSLVFSIGFLQRIDGHVSIDILLKSLSPLQQHLVRGIISPFVGLLYTGPLTYKSFIAALYSLQIGERSQSIWAEPLWPVKIVIPIGYGLLSAVLLLQLFSAFGSRRGRWKQE